MLPIVFLRKILSLVVIAALLSLRLSSLTPEVFVIPVEDAIFEIPFIAAECSSPEGKPSKTKPKRAPDIILAPLAELEQRAGRPQPSPIPVTATLTLKDVHAEIFIPPEAIS